MTLEGAMTDISRRTKPSELELIDRYIDQEVDQYAGGRADTRLRDSGVSVWAIVTFMRVYHNDQDKVAAHFDLSVQEIEAALAYYRANKAYIDARITLNEA
jgi:uncharacterized protein (DUF433 family)